LRITAKNSGEEMIAELTFVINGSSGAGGGRKGGSGVLSSERR